MIIPRDSYSGFCFDDCIYLDSTMYIAIGLNSLSIFRWHARARRGLFSFSNLTFLATKATLEKDIIEVQKKCAQKLSSNLLFSKQLLT
jgi:hypothetical protein